MEPKTKITLELTEHEIKMLREFCGRQMVTSQRRIDKATLRYDSACNALFAISRAMDLQPGDE